MKMYHIIQIEDESDKRESIESWAKRKEMSYLGTASLEDLEMCLLSAKARVYVVDGKFPRTKGGPVEELASEAISTIRCYDNDADIILYSSNSFIDRLAEENGVIPIPKDKPPRELVDHIQRMLSE